MEKIYQGLKSRVEKHNYQEETKRERKEIQRKNRARSEEDWVSPGCKQGRERERTRRLCGEREKPAEEAPPGKSISGSGAGWR